jgi:hypothetical protein
MNTFLKLTLSIFFMTTSVHAQIVVDCNAPNNTATALVNLLVDGVPFSNATLTGFDCAAGYFNGASGMLNIRDVIIVVDSNTPTTNLANVLSNASGVVDISNGTAIIETDAD